MSKRARSFYVFVLVSFVALPALSTVSAQAIEAEITVDKSRPVISVSGRFVSVSQIKNPRNFSFVRETAGFSELGARISGVELLGSDGKPVRFRKLMDGEFLAEENFASWRYEVDVTPRKDQHAAAHVSWISNQNGIVFTADIFPVNAKSGKIVLALPDGWRVHSWDRSPAERVFNITDLSRGVLAIGKNWSEKVLSLSDTQLFFVISGTRHFSFDDAFSMAGEIYSGYRERLGRSVEGHAHVILSEFPLAGVAGNWEAETKGRTVTIVSSDMPFRTQSLQRLHEQLRHELFHLWFPNGVNLTGKYDWFYEGFALYESLKLAVGLNRIRFEDFLDTLSRAHTIDSAQSQRSSLIQASVGRFAGSNTQVYARGMLVAFLCDLAMLQQSKGKKSVENVLKQLFENHRLPAASTDANTAILSLLRSNPSLVIVVDRYVTGAENIEWANDLAAFGIEDADPGPLTTLRVRDKLNGRQKTLLDKLGYNNWRKLSPTSK
jgi:hypothetical protein